MNFNKASFICTGLPLAEETISFGLPSQLKTYRFVQNPSISTSTDIEIGDTVAELIERTVAIINSTDGNDWLAEVDGSRINLTPPSGDAGSMVVRSAASNFEVGYESPDIRGVILSG